jgi:arsenate reductase-like glutaredoxin family protein
VTIDEQVDARKNKLGPAEALALVGKARRLWVAKGKKVVELDLKRDSPSDEDLLALILGPSGNLRAPVIRRGVTLFVGFEPDVIGAEIVK